MMHWGWNGLGWGNMPIMMLVMVLFWGGLIVFVALGAWALLHSRTGSGGLRGSSSRALEILQERYARGEITREQYDQMKRDLMT
jgi:putative membrane protein